MTSKLFKRLSTMVLGGAAMLLLAVPTTASAHDWDHHDNGHHYGWYHGDRDDDYRFHRADDCDDQGGYRSPGYYSAPPLGYGYGNNPRMNYFQQEWAKAEAKHQRALANGNRYAAKVTSKRLYQLDRDMGFSNGYGRYYNRYNNNGYYNNGSYNAAPVLGPLGNLFGIW
jgi:hypothetical protein